LREITGSFKKKGKKKYYYATNPEKPQTEKNCDLFLSQTKGRSAKKRKKLRYSYLAYRRKAPKSYQELQKKTGKRK